jgi:hypothetical protein
MEVSCVIDAINKAKARRNTDLPLILHSDYAEENTIPKFFLISLNSPIVHNSSA